MEENYNYIMTRSAFNAITIWRILFIWTIIPIFIILVHIWILKSDRTYFCNDKIVSKSGIFSKHIKETSFVGISAICVDQSFLGRLFDFGDVHIDVVGKWKVTIKGVKRPLNARQFLAQYIIKKEGVNTPIIEA